MKERFLGFRAPDELVDKLDTLCRLTGLSKTYYLKKGLECLMDDKEKLGWFDLAKKVENLNECKNKKEK